MLDDKLICPNCKTKFYFNEVRNIIKHRKKEMPICCPECGYKVKNKLSHGYFVTYKEENFEDKNSISKKEAMLMPKQYKNIKTGAVISSEEYQRLIEENDRLVNQAMSSEFMDGENVFLEKELLNDRENYEDYIPYYED